MSMTKFSLLPVAASFALALTASTAIAQTAPAAAAPASPHTFTANIALVSDYRFRGMSQTWKRPALQGGIDYSHSSGFYLGNWNSMVARNQYYGGAGLEMDFYGGWKGEIAKDVTLDVGGLLYYYPGANYGKAAGVPSGRFTNFEPYVGLSYKWFSAKYFISTTNWFGLGAQQDNALFGVNRGTTGSQYLDITGTFDVVDKVQIIAHAGFQSVRGNSNLNNTDLKLGVTYDWNSIILGATAYVNDPKNRAAWDTTQNINPFGGSVRNVSKGALVLSVTKNF